MALWRFQLPCSATSTVPPLWKRCGKALVCGTAVLPEVVGIACSGSGGWAGERGGGRLRVSSALRLGAAEWQQSGWACILLPSEREKRACQTGSLKAAGTQISQELEAATGKRERNTREIRPPEQPRAGPAPGREAAWSLLKPGMGQQEVSAREQGPYGCTKMRPSGGSPATCKAPRLPCPLSPSPPAHLGTAGLQWRCTVQTSARHPPQPAAQRQAAPVMGAALVWVAQRVW